MHSYRCQRELYIGILPLWQSKEHADGQYDSIQVQPECTVVALMHVFGTGVAASKHKHMSKRFLLESILAHLINTTPVTEEQESMG